MYIFVFLVLPSFVRFFLISFHPNGVDRPVSSWWAVFSARRMTRKIIKYKANHTQNKTKIKKYQKALSTQRDEKSS